MTQAEAAVVRDQVVVDAPLTQAFAVFTELFGDFKPPEHNLLGAEIAETVFEPRVGGHIYDRAVDGTECRWARVLVPHPAVPRQGHASRLAQPPRRIRSPHRARA